MKRFTETEKWSDPWFRKLSIPLKCLWIYLCDQCSCAGVWDADIELAEFQIGGPIDQQEALKVFAGRVEVLSDGKWMLTKFVKFQYGALSPRCKPHSKVLSELNQLELNGRVSKGYTKGIYTLQEEEEEKDNSTGKGGTGGNPVNGKFQKPTAEELELHAARIGLPESEISKFVNHYESNGWKVGKNPMRCWRSAMTGWRTRWEERRSSHQPSIPNI